MENAPLVTIALVIPYQTSSIALILVMPSQKSTFAAKVAVPDPLHSLDTTPLALMIIMAKLRKFALWDTTAATVPRACAQRVNMARRQGWGVRHALVHVALVIVRVYCVTIYRASPSFASLHNAVGWYSHEHCIDFFV